VPIPVATPKRVTHYPCHRAPIRCRIPLHPSHTGQPIGQPLTGQGTVAFSREETGSPPAAATTRSGCGLPSRHQRCCATS